MARSDGSEFITNPLLSEAHEAAIMEDMAAMFSSHRPSIEAMWAEVVRETDEERELRKALVKRIAEKLGVVGELEELRAAKQARRDRIEADWRRLFEGGENGPS